MQLRKLIRLIVGKRACLPFVVAICSAVLVTGCGAERSKPAGITVRLSTWGSAQEVEVLRAQLADFEKYNPKIHIELMHIPDNYYQKLHIMIAAGLTPDVVFTNSIYLPVYASQGIFRPLQLETTRKTDLDTADFYPVALEALAWQGKQYALPRDVSNLVMFVNQDAFARAGLALPAANWTWSDFLKTARHLTADTNRDGHLERFGVSFYRTPPLFWLPFVWSAGGDVFDPSRQGCLLNSQSAVEGLQFYADLRNRYHVAPRQAESGSATMSDLFLQGKVAMMLSGRWSVPMLREQAKFRWNVVPFPLGAAGSRVGIDASGYAISAKTAYPQESMRLIAYLLSRQSVAAVAKSGLIVPARKDVAESPAFLEADQPPANSRAFLTAMTNGVPTRSAPRWNEIAEVIGLSLESAWDGKKTVQQALTGVCNAIEPLLTEGDAL